MYEGVCLPFVPLYECLSMFVGASLACESVYVCRRMFHFCACVYANVSPCVYVNLACLHVSVSVHVYRYNSNLCAMYVSVCMTCVSVYANVCM